MDRRGEVARRKKKIDTSLLEERLVFRCARRARPRFTTMRRARGRHPRLRFHDLLSVKLVVPGRGFKVGSIRNVPFRGAPFRIARGRSRPFLARWFIVLQQLVNSEHQRTINKLGFAVYIIPREVSLICQVTFTCVIIGVTCETVLLSE